MKRLLARVDATLRTAGWPGYYQVLNQSCSVYFLNSS